MAHEVLYRAEYFKEGDLYVALAVELGVSSFAETLDEAKASLQEAVEAFLEWGCPALVDSVAADS